MHFLVLLPGLLTGFISPGNLGWLWEANTCNTWRSTSLIMICGWGFTYTDDHSSLILLPSQLNAQKDVFNLATVGYCAIISNQITIFILDLGSPGGSVAKNLPAVLEIWVQFLGWEHALEKGMATHSSILAWRIPWTENLVGCSPWGHKESDITEWPALLLSFYI